MIIKELNLKEGLNKIEFDSIMYNLYFDFGYIDEHNSILFNTLITAFILKQNDVVEARVALFHSNVDQVIFFGHFEAINFESGVELLTHAIQHVKEKDNSIRLVGPINGLTWNPYRLAKNNEHSLFKNDLCNPLYYCDIMNACGFIENETYYTNIQTNFSIKQHAIPTEYQIKTFSLEELKEKGKEIYDITMKAFKHSPYFTPLPYQVFEQQYQKQLYKINHEISPFIIDNNGAICAYSSCYLSNNGDGIVVKTIARKLDRKHAGLGRLLSDEICSIAMKKNYKYILHAFMHQNNSSKSLSERFNGSPLKSYALYQHL